MRPPAGAWRRAPVINAGTPLMRLSLARARAVSNRFYQKWIRRVCDGRVLWGLMAYNVSADPRSFTVGIWNSDLLLPDDLPLHSSVIIATGGGKRHRVCERSAIQTMPARVPVFWVYLRCGGTYAGQRRRVRGAGWRG